MINFQKKIKEYDKDNFKKSILTVPEQLLSGEDLLKNISLPELEFEKIMISGMGGSALTGDILRMYLNASLTNNKKDDIIEVCQNRFYKLPLEAYKNCLNIVCSYSGNTEETLSSFKEIIENNLPVVTISSGGILEDLSKENNIPHIKLPKPSDNFQPRMATGYFTSVIIHILEKYEKITLNKSTIDAIVTQLKNSTDKLQTEGKELSVKLFKKTIIIYAPEILSGLGLIWKIGFNENSKTPAFWNFFPELNHNEFLGFKNSQSDYHIVMLKSSLDDARNIKRYLLTAELLKKQNVETTILDIPQGNILYSIFSSILLSNWTSYYLALLYKTNPTEVKLIEDFKHSLS